MAPAPIAKTVKALPKEEFNPKDTNMGAIIAAVVIIDTVEDPCEDFKIAAIKNGNNKPSLRSENALPIMSPIPVACKIAPNAPPAPVMRMIMPASFRPLDTQFRCESSFDFGFNLNARNTPINSDIMGLPMKLKTVATIP